MTPTKTDDTYVGQVTVRLIGFKVITEAQALATTSVTANHVGHTTTLTETGREGWEERLSGEAFDSWEESLKKRQ